MNLNKIIVKMDQLNHEHELIKDRYSESGKIRNIFRQDIRQDNANDLRIFGYTQQQAVQELKKNQAKRLTDTNEQRKIKDSFIEAKTESPMQNSQSQAQSRKLKYHALLRGKSANHRIKSAKETIKKKHFSAHKLVQKNCSYSNKLYCLVKDLGRDQSNFIKFEPVEHSTFYSTSKKEKVEEANKKLCRRSIKDYSKKFSQKFKQNINVMKVLEKSSQKGLKKNKNQVIFHQKQSRHQKSFSLSFENKRPDQFFALTQTANFERNIENQTIDSLNFLKNLAYLLCDQFETNSYLKQRKINSHLSKPVWQILKRFDGYTIFIIQMNKIKTYKFQRNAFYLIQNVVSMLTKKQESFHFGIYCQNFKKLIYEEFIFTSKLATLKKQQRAIFQYFVKRFLCLDESFQEIESVCLYAKSFIKSQVKIPIEFEEFIISMDNKECLMYNLKNITRGSLKNILMKGLRLVKDYKRKLKWQERKPVLISIKKSKKYFYI